jgi:hypothetical protein
MKNSGGSRSSKPPVGQKNPENHCSEQPKGSEPNLEPNEAINPKKAKLKPSIKPFPRPTVKARHYKATKE